MDPIKVDTLIIEKKLTSNFQQIMQRVWLDNTFVTGLEEVRVILEQIIQSAEGSREVIGELSGVVGQREALQKEWAHKVSMLESFMESFTTVLNQYREERQKLES